MTEATDPIPYIYHCDHALLCSTGILPTPLHAGRVAGNAQAGAAPIPRLAAAAPPPQAAGSWFFVFWQLQSTMMPPHPALERAATSSPDTEAVL